MSLIFTLIALSIVFILLIIRPDIFVALVTGFACLLICAILFWIILLLLLQERGILKEKMEEFKDKIIEAMEENNENKLNKIYKQAADYYFDNNDDSDIEMEAVFKDIVEMVMDADDVIDCTNPTELLAFDKRKNRNSRDYKVFRKAVLKRDGNACIMCGAKHCTLTVHHLDAYCWCVEKRTEVDNGVTLCVPCHTRFHKEYGQGYVNTRLQFKQYTYERLLEAIKKEIKFKEKEQ